MLCSLLPEISMILILLVNKDLYEYDLIFSILFIWVILIYEHFIINNLENLGDCKVALISIFVVITVEALQ